MYDKMSDYFTISDIKQRYPNRILFLESLTDMGCGKGSGSKYYKLRMLMQDVEENLQRSDRYTFSGRSDSAYIIQKMKWYQLPFNGFNWFRYQRTTISALIVIRNVLETSK